MPGEIQTIGTDNIGDALTKLEDAYFDIPFENSDFQNKAFVVAAQQTPARAYRALGLKLFSKINAVREYMYAREKTEIDLEEKEAAIADERTNPFDRRRLELEIKHIRSGQRYSEKLLNDALFELNSLYAVFAEMHPYTRVQFEAEERAHFEAKLNRQIQTHGNGSAESLLNMHEDMPSMPLRINNAKAELIRLGLLPE